MENEITRNLVFLATSLTNLEIVLLHLEQKGIISTNERDGILLPGTPLEKNMRFLDMIKRKDYNANKNFIMEILRMTSNEHCANKIEGIRRQTETALQESSNNGVAKLGEMLRGVDIAESNNEPTALSRHPGNSKMINQIWFGVTAPNRCYTGRETEMELLGKYWNDCTTNKTVSIVAVTGLGGIGKSELAKNFAKWFHENIKGHCIWVEAETPQSVEESFKNLAENLKISLKDHLRKDRIFQEIVEEVYEKLFGEKVLFVFDNVENYESPVLQLLFDLSSKRPPTVVKPFVIATSRIIEAKKYFGTLCNQIDLQVLTKISASQFLYKSLSLSEPLKNIPELVDKLSERLQFYPLALQQAAANINERFVYSGNVHEAIAQYLTEIEKQAKALLDYKLPKYEALEKVSNTTLLTWRITVDKLRESRNGGELAVDIMNIFSFLSSDNIPTRMVTNILQKMGKGSDVADKTNIFDLIRKYSMINYSAANIVSVHRLVQEVTLIELEERGEFRTLLDEIAKAMTGMLKAKETPLKELVHVKTVWQHLTKEKELIEEHGEILWQICIELFNSGKYRDLLDFSIESGELVESTLGQNHRWTLQMKNMKGRALSYLSEYSEALQVLEETYERQKTSLGEEHRDCLNTAKEIGYVYYLLNKYEDAMQIYNDAVEKAETIYGKEYTYTLRLKHNIAMVLDEQNKLKEALELYTEILEVEERLLGVEHPNTLTTKHNIAGVKFDLKDYEEALKDFQEVLEIRERVMEFNHPNTLEAKYWIALVYYHLGRPQESLTIFQEVHESQVQILGQRHPSTISTNTWIQIVEMKIALERFFTLF